MIFLVINDEYITKICIFRDNTNNTYNQFNQKNES